MECFVGLADILNDVFGKFKSAKTSNFIQILYVKDLILGEKQQYGVILKYLDSTKKSVSK